MVRSLVQEKPHHTQAFETYYRLGAKRSYKAVGQELGLSASAVKLMARSFHWSARIQERDATVARQAADQVIGSAVADASRKRKMVELALLKVIKAINSDKVRIQVGDLDRLLRLQAFLDGNRVPLTVEALHQHAPEEVGKRFIDWFFTLNADERQRAIAAVQRREDGRTIPDGPPESLPPPPPIEGQNSGGEGTERDSPEFDPPEGP